MNKNIGCYFHTSTQEDMIDSLRMIARFSKEIQGDKYAWKWLIISYHSCIQGLFILSLEKGNGLSSMKDNIAREWVKSYKHNRKNPDDLIEYPEPYLDDFKNLYKKVKEHCLGSISDYDEAILILHNELRNNFIHFSPKVWLIEISLMLETCQTLYGLVNRLARNPCGFILYEENQPEQIPLLLDEIACNLAAFQEQ